MDKNGQYSNWNPRIPVFYAVFAAAFLFLLGTLAYRQIYLYDYYSQRGERQSMRRIIEPGARGDIYDRNMKLLVTNEPRFSAVVYFNEIRREFRREYMRLKKIELARRRGRPAELFRNFKPRARKCFERIRGPDKLHFGFQLQTYDCRLQ